MWTIIEVGTTIEVWTTIGVTRDHPSLCVDAKKSSPLHSSDQLPNLRHNVEGRVPAEREQGVNVQDRAEINLEICGGYLSRSWGR